VHFAAEREITNALGVSSPSTGTRPFIGKGSGRGDCFQIHPKEHPRNNRTTRGVRLQNCGDQREDFYKRAHEFVQKNQVSSLEIPDNSFIGPAVTFISAVINRPYWLKTSLQLP